MTSAARLLENAGVSLIKDKALISVSVTKQKEEIDTENQFDKWKAAQPTTIYDMSVNPKGDIYWWWTCITSVACSYNLIFITLLIFEKDSIFTGLRAILFVILSFLWTCGFSPECKRSELREQLTRDNNCQSYLIRIFEVSNNSSKFSYMHPIVSTLQTVID
uniref:Transmembrane protein n=1 Tax=Heterorhabditis bacteriophora TaxID=37862 RepID=A0A1I7X7T2_HETBA